MLKAEKTEMKKIDIFLTIPLCCKKEKKSCFVILTNFLSVVL